MVTRRHSDHFISYVNVELLCCSPEVNITLYVSYTLLVIEKQVSQHFLFPLFPLALFIWLLGSVSDGVLYRSTDQVVLRVPEEAESQGLTRWLECPGPLRLSGSLYLTLCWLSPD